MTLYQYCSIIRIAIHVVQVSGFSSFTSLTVLSMGSNRLGEAASFWLPSLAGVLEADASKGPDDPGQGISALPQTSSLFPMLQILRLHENSIKSIQGLQLHGFTGEAIRHAFFCVYLTCVCQNAGLSECMPKAESYSESACRA